MALSIGNKILLGFLAVILAVLLLGIGMLEQFATVRDISSTAVSRDLTLLRQIDKLGDMQQELIERQQSVFIAFLLQHDGLEVAAAPDATANWQQQEAAVESVLASLVSTTNGYRNLALSASRAAAFQRLATILQQWTAELRMLHSDTSALFQQIAGGDLTHAIDQRQRVMAHREVLSHLLDQANGTVNETILAGNHRIEQAYSNAELFVGGGLLVVILISIVTTLLIRRSIAVPLAGFIRFVEQVGRGDLTGQAATIRRDELGRLGGYLNDMVQGLRALARQSREATENLNASVAEIRASAQEQAAGVEEQLAAVQETAATVDQIMHAGAQITSRAKEVIAAAQATAASSSAGVRAVEETTHAMDGIREQAEAVAETIVALSEKMQAIGDITLTVNDVSERSHLLALNAAIEAATAGESGRRFAVVAAEMKSLADQAKGATSQVRSILGDIERGITSSVMLTEEAVKRVASGKEKTDATLRTINEMAHSIQESVQTFQQIVASTNQQQLGVEQVTIALQNIRQASQQTAAGTRQLEGAAGALNSLSQQLVSLTERYQV